MSTPNKDLAEQTHHNLHRQHGKVKSQASATFSVCNVLHYLGISHLFKIIRLLIHKIFKWARATFSQLWINMSTYFVLNPPLVLFGLNATLFAVILTFISLYARVVEVAESGEEWKFFLQSVSKLELCIVPFELNSTSAPMSPTPPTIKRLLKSHSIPISLSINPTMEFVRSPWVASHLSTVMFGKYIGLQEDKSHAPINITLSFRHTWNSSACDESKLAPCQFIDVEGCITFRGPRDIFPENKHLEHCPRSRKDSSGSHFYAGLNWQIPDVNPLYYCRSRSIIKGNFDRFLSKTSSEKVIDPSARLHLLGTSFFLTLFVSAMLLYAAIFDHRKCAYSRRHSTSCTGEVSSLQ